MVCKRAVGSHADHYMLRKLLFAIRAFMRNTRPVFCHSAVSRLEYAASAEGFAKEMTIQQPCRSKVVSSYIFYFVAYLSENTSR